MWQCFTRMVTCESGTVVPLTTSVTRSARTLIDGNVNDLISRVTVLVAWIERPEARMPVPKQAWKWSLESRPTPDRLSMGLSWLSYRVRLMSWFDWPSMQLPRVASNVSISGSAAPAPAANELTASIDTIDAAATR